MQDMRFCIWAVPSPSLRLLPNDDQRILSASIGPNVARAATGKPKNLERVPIPPLPLRGRMMISRKGGGMPSPGLRVKGRKARTQIRIGGMRTVGSRISSGSAVSTRVFYRFYISKVRRLTAKLCRIRSQKLSLLSDRMIHYQKV